MQVSGEQNCSWAEGNVRMVWERGCGYEANHAFSGRTDTTASWINIQVPQLGLGGWGMDLPSGRVTYREEVIRVLFPHLGVD